MMFDPLASNAPHESNPNKLRQPSDVLVVENDLLFLWSLEHVLNESGYVVCAVTDAQSALDELSKRAFDFVISNYDLAGVDGKRVIKTANSLCPRARTILISAYQLEELGDQEGIRLDAFMNKPIELKVLKQLLDQMRDSVCTFPGLADPTPTKDHQ